MPYNKQLTNLTCLGLYWGILALSHSCTDLAALSPYCHNLGLIFPSMALTRGYYYQTNLSLCPNLLADFGLSNICQGENLLKTQCGSPEYAAPELFRRGCRYGTEVDLWSLWVHKKDQMWFCCLYSYRQRFSSSKCSKCCAPGKSKHCFLQQYSTSKKMFISEHYKPRLQQKEWASVV